MIDSGFFFAFDNTIANVAADIAETRRKLAAEEGRDTAGALRVRITYLGKLLESLTASSAAIRTADGKIDEMPRRYAKWRELANAARETEAEVLALHELVAPACEAFAAAQAVVERAEREWQLELPRQVHQLATEPEKKRKRESEAELRREYDGALADLRLCAQRWDSAQKAVFDARLRFDAAQFQERVNRVPDDPTQDHGGKAWAAA
jgi:hypothetical protein